MRDLASARAPSARLGAALYESHYLTAVDAAGGRAVWLRYTALKSPGATARPTVWLTWFDRSAPGPRAWRVTASQPVTDPGASWARSALGVLGPGAARGAIGEAAWDLTWEPRAAVLPYLPARWLYDRRVPRSGGVALAPSALVSGSIGLDGGEPVLIEGWNGMIGHNWGSEHAEQWTWLHAGGLGPDRAGWLDFVLVRIRLGPLLTPWIAAGAVHIDGRTLATARRGRVSRELRGERTAVRVPLAGAAVLELTASAPAAATVSWDYASPSGRGRAVQNCSVADATLVLHTRSGDRAFEVAAGLAVEHGAPS